MKATIIFIAMVIISGGIYCQTPLDDANWETTNPFFQDEFTTFPISSTVWNIYNCKCPYPGPDNYQTWIDRPENVTSNGSEMLLSVTDDGPFLCNSCSNVPIYTKKYIIPFMESRDVIPPLFQTFQYGFFESEITMPLVNGCNSAFWLWDTDQHSYYREIDITETWSGRTDNHNSESQLHYNQNVNTTALHISSTPVDDPYRTDGRIFYMSDYTRPHKYAVEWTPSKIIWYLDDKIIRNSVNPGIYDRMHILFDIALFQGDTYFMYPEWWGPFSDPDSPATMKVGYIKVYKYKCGDKPLSECQIDFNTLTYEVRPYIKIGGSGCINSVPSEMNVSLRAEQFIEINGDFSVPLGSSLYLDVNACD